MTTSNASLFRRLRPLRRLRRVIREELAEVKNDLAELRTELRALPSASAPPSADPNAAEAVSLLKQLFVEIAKTQKGLSDQIIPCQNWLDAIGSVTAQTLNAVQEEGAKYHKDLADKVLTNLDWLKRISSETTNLITHLTTSTHARFDQLEKVLLPLLRQQSDACAPAGAPGLHDLHKAEHSAGYAYVARLPAAFPPGDTVDQPESSRACLLEDGVLLGPGHCAHETIADEGLGRFSHWNKTLVFSASDNSDPRTNGRRYSVFVPREGSTTQKGRAIHIMERLPDSFTSQDAFLAVERCLDILYPAARIGEDGKRFWHDERLLGIHKNLLSDNMRSYERKFAVYQLVKGLAPYSGDLAEVGTYTGATAYFMGLACKDRGRTRPMHLFDSFEGLSAPAPEDGSVWREGDLAATEETVRRNLAEFQDVHLYKGWVPDRFPEVADRRFAFVHIDVDLYGPTKMTLEFFYPRLVPGGILVCDDYGSVICPGAQRAMEEFFADKPESLVHLPTMQGFVIKRQPGAAAEEETRGRDEPVGMGQPA